MKDRKPFMFSDQLIGQIREILQLSIMTGTHIVDIFRLLRAEEDLNNPGKLVLTPEYVEHYNNMINKMMSELEEIKKAELKLAAKSVKEQVEKKN